ncbi:hypothetical protein [Streptomyces sp. NPDC048272]|uniref:hypothetical protein n=1 Tax=Streptomyces sp. NPDC048272 TaxID=3154616 RepID=UPI003422D402
MSHIMPHPIDPDLLFAVLMASPVPLPHFEYAVRTPYTDFFGPSYLISDETDDLAEAERAVSWTTTGVLVERVSGSATWTEVAR